MPENDSYWVCGDEVMQLYIDGVLVLEIDAT